MTVLIFGAKGYLGQAFLTVYPDAVTTNADIADSQAVAHVLDEVKPTVVINTAGKTGRPNIDWCEEHKMETVRSNVTGPLVLLEECAKRGIYWVNLGSGCIYEGDNDGRGCSEEDPPNFSGSFYSRTKQWIDRILKEFPVLVLRLRMPFDGSANPRNLITKISGYSRVLDVPNSITYLPDFLTASSELIEKGKTGLYNIVNPGVISPYRIMQIYKEIVNPAHAFERLTIEEMPQVARAGRSNCILSGKKLEAEGIRMRPVGEAVTEALKRLKEG
ncbi:MAG: sugar nucleotide-binding protein [Candidatus Peribacteraceae bacterium]|nr:sugar nucleotide-binding protein [Candidatus Peribacteraceae bacterium]